MYRNWPGLVSLCVILTGPHFFSLKSSEEVPLSEIAELSSISYHQVSLVTFFSFLSMFRQRDVYLLRVTAAGFISFHFAREAFYFRKAMVAGQTGSRGFFAFLSLSQYFSFFSIKSFTWVFPSKLCLKIFLNEDRKCLGDLGCALSLSLSRLSGIYLSRAGCRVPVGWSVQWLAIPQLRAMLLIHGGWLLRFI